MTNQCLELFFREHPRAALGFSGGVDSAFLLHAAREAGADVVPYFVRTQFQPAFEMEDAQRLAREVGVALRVIELDALADPHVVRNGPDRCYFCKRRIFAAIREAARADGYDAVIDGTNATDDADDRPGMRALAELGVLSPLRRCGIGKDEVRALSRRAGLFTADKPSYSCLATRIADGTELTEEKLRLVERAEAFLFSRGFADFRVRLRGGEARIQLPAAQMPQLVAQREDVLAAFDGFTAVTLDLYAR